MTYTGAKYDSNRDVKEIAKMLRKDLKAEYPKCKFSVRISRFAGGQSIDVSIKETNLEMIHNPHRVQQEKSDVNYRPAGNEHRYLLPAEKLLEHVNSMLNAYREDKSDTMTDYFCVNFYGRAEYDYDLEQSDKEKIMVLDPKQVEDIWWADHEKRQVEWEEKRQAEEKKREAEAEAERLEREANAPIAVKKVVFEWSESCLVDEGQEFSTLSEANGKLFEIACERHKESPERGHYTKTKITIEWVNGDSYTGRWDVNALDGGVGPDCADCHIGLHITGFSEFQLRKRNDPKYSLFTKNSDETWAFYQALVDGKYEV